MNTRVWIVMIILSCFASDLLSTVFTAYMLVLLDRLHACVVRSSI